MFSVEDLKHEPRYYHRDGTPILDSELMPAFMQWALLFETSERIIGDTKTLYGERLSTVWLGLDHSFFGGRPLLFETMLFAPDDCKALLPTREELRRSITQLHECTARLMAAETLAEVKEQWGDDPQKTEEQKQRDEENERREAYRKKHYPHDQLQERYHTENEARDNHEKLTMQCLIPPRWRHFLLWTIGRQSAWSHWDDKDED